LGRMRLRGGVDATAIVYWQVVRGEEEFVAGS
jgi:hypothetical protein